MKAKRGDRGFNATLLNLKRGLVTAILAVSVLAMFIAVASAAERHVGPDQAYSTIQSAEDAATAGDTIIVHDGTYTENVDVDVAHLTIRSENGSDSTAVHAPSAGEDVFNVTADYVNISGFTVTGAEGYDKAGVYLHSVEHCDISDNNVSDNPDGIVLNQSSYNTLTNNTANSQSSHGICLMQSSYNTLTNNTANSNPGFGIGLCKSCNNNITCNWVAHNEQRGFTLGFGSTGNNISYNNIMSNGVAASGSWHYNFYNGQDDAVTATNNYWGTTSSAVIAESICTTGGTVTYDPFLNNPDPCAPIPELATIIAILPGLVVLAGYVRWRKRK